jgi:AcrR family transcriptional regulator
MPRVVKDYDERYAEFLEAAQQLFFSQGYERTTVQEIIDTVGVAKGTFYYYFGSKQAVLEAVVADLSAQKRALSQAIMDDNTLSIIQKWTRMVQVGNDWKIERKAELLDLLRVLQTDENIPLLHKLQVERPKVAAPEFAKLIAQGIAEGVFETDYVEESAEIVYAISRALSDTLTDILLNPGNYDDPESLAQRKLAAMQTAIERVLGAAPGSLSIIDAQMLAAWLED